jgi:nitrogen regulatory protein PII
VKKIEAIIGPDTLEAVKLHLAEVGIGGRLTVIQAKGVEGITRFYQCESSGEVQSKPCLLIDLIVSDRQVDPAVNVILQHAKQASRHRSLDRLLRQSAALRELHFTASRECYSWSGALARLWIRSSTG